jgi:hypothetical protein
MIFNPADLDRFKAVIAGNSGMYGQSFVCKSMEIRFSRFLVLKIK